MTDSTRRELLRGAVGVGIATSLAGCTDEDLEDLESLLEDLESAENGSDEPDEPEDDPGRSPGELPPFHEWLYAPGEAELGPYTYASARMTEIDDREFAPFENWEGLRWTTDTLEGFWRDDEFDDAAFAVVTKHEDGDSFGAAIEGGFDLTGIHAEIESNVENESEIGTTTYAGYDLYFNEEFAVALGEGSEPKFLQSHVASSGPTSAEELIQTMIDTREGATTRLHERDSTAETLLRTLGDKQVAVGATEPAGQAASLFEHPRSESIDGVGVGVQSDTYTVVTVTDEPVTDADAFGTELAIAGPLENRSVRQNNEMFVLEGSIGEATQPDSEPPRAAFDADFDFDRGVAEVTHVGGDVVPAHELEVVVESDGHRAYPWIELAGSRDVQPGDTARLPIDEEDGGGALTLYWRPGSEILDEIRIPETESSDLPSAEFEAEFDLEGGTARLIHVGGDVIPAHELEVVVESHERRSYPWIELTGTEDAQPGDVAELPVDERDGGGRLLFHWRPGSEVLDTARIPDHETADSVPVAAFDARFDLESGEVTVVHTDGDEIPADELVLVFYGRYREIAWSELSGGTTVAPGDSITADLADEDYGTELLVGWLPETEVLEEFAVPHRDDTDSHDQEESQ